MSFPEFFDCAHYICGVRVRFDCIFLYFIKTGTGIIIRGKGSVKEGKVGHKDGRPLPAQDEPLHAYITGNNPENVKKAVERVITFPHLPALVI